MYNNNIRTDSEIHQFINSEFRNDRLRLEWPLPSARSCAGWDNNNKDDVCTRMIPTRKAKVHAPIQDHLIDHLV